MHQLYWKLLRIKASAKSSNCKRKLSASSPVCVFQASRKFFAVTFMGSILWIGVFSYLMVWWAHQVRGRL